MPPEPAASPVASVIAAELAAALAAEAAAPEPEPAQDTQEDLGAPTHQESEDRSKRMLKYMKQDTSSGDKGLDVMVHSGNYTSKAIPF